MNVRPATDADVAQMFRVRMSVRENRLADLTAVQPHHYREMLAAGAGWVCEIDDKVVGFAIPDDRTGSVWALFVDPAYERRGIGRQLHDVVVAWLFASGHERIFLTTDQNTRAEHFYQSAGWQRVGPAPYGEIRYELTPEAFTPAEPPGTR
jgi:GNAT superfamily N-acetyltransferase